MGNAKMIKRLIKGLAWAKRLPDERGNALVELVICMPLLLVLAFGLIDFSQMIFDKQTMAGISRQGSNLASRNYTGPTGSMPLSTVVSALVTQGASLNIGTNGRIIVTVVADDVQAGNPTNSLTRTNRQLVSRQPAKLAPGLGIQPPCRRVPPTCWTKVRRSM